MLLLVFYCNSCSYYYSFLLFSNFTFHATCYRRTPYSVFTMGPPSPRYQTHLCTCIFSRNKLQTSNFLRRMKRAPSRLFSCGHADENVCHLLLECPRHKSARRRIEFDAIRSTTIHPEKKNTSPMNNSGASKKSACRFKSFLRRYQSLTFILNFSVL